MNKRGFGEALYPNADPAKRAAKLQLRDLSDMDKRIYELNLDRVPNKEIASMCGITPANARKKWFDIRRRLLKNKYIFNRVHELGLVG